MTLVDYSSHFWGDKHIGYHVLYENMKKNENVVYEFSNFIREWVAYEEESLKFFHRNLGKINNFVTNNGSFIDSWRITKEIFEQFSDVQTSALKNLNELFRDVTRFHNDIVKQRKRVSKDNETIEAVNLMQTTTTCLMKAKETYNHRYNEVKNLKNDAINNKEYLKAKNKLNRAHNEYRSYIDKYAIVRENFEEHDHSLLNQLKSFFIIFSSSLESAYSSMTQSAIEYKENLRKVCIEDIMLHFIEEKGTGNDKPPPLKWQDSDDPPLDFEIISAFGGGSAQSSSNSSAIIVQPPENCIQTVDDLLGLDELWTANSSKKCDRQHSESTLLAFQKSYTGESDSDEKSNNEHKAHPSSSAAQTSSNVMPQISSWISRQKLSNWRKKYSASHSNLPALTGDPSLEGSIIDFNPVTNYNGNPIAPTNSVSSTSSSLKSNAFLKRYQKKKTSGSIKQREDENSRQKRHSMFLDELSTKDTGDTKFPMGGATDSLTPAVMINPLEQFGPPPPLPSTDPPPLLMDDISLTLMKRFFDPMKPEELTTGNDIINESLHQQRAATVSSSESSSDEDEVQAAKIRTLHIKPLDKQKTNTPASINELKAAVSHLTLTMQKSNTLDQDPWSHNKEDRYFPSVGNRNMLRASHTGDEHIRQRRITDFDRLSTTSEEISRELNSSPGIDNSGIVRSRPRGSLFQHNNL